MLRILFCLIVSLAGTLAGATGSGVLAGTVRSQDGTPIPQLVLTLVGPEGSRTVVSGPGGRFRVFGLAPGDYRMEVSAPGFLLSPEPHVTISDGEARLDFALAPAPLREHVVVAATRGEAPMSELGSSVSVIGGEEAVQKDPAALLDLLPFVPGVSTARSGGIGLYGTAFLRGGESNFSRVLVDGVPVNEPGGFFNFGSLMPLELDRIEVVRGATSSLYGTDALAGVIQIVTRAAGPDARQAAHAEAEGGSFSWRRGEAGSSGRAGAFDWNAGIERLETNNQEPNSAFRETTGAASLGARLSESTLVRLVIRGETSTVGTPGQTAFQRPDLDASYDWKGLTLSAELHKTGDTLAHTLRAGYALTDQLSLDPLNSGTFVPRYGNVVGPFPISDFTDPKGFQNNTRRQSLGYEAELRAGAGHLLSIGADLERETGSIGSLTTGPVVSPGRTNVGVYLQDRATLAGRLFVTLGGRVERNDSFGTRAVPRLAMAYRAWQGSGTTTIHASAGLGIKEPSFLQTFGTSFFALGNPSLKPERSRTFDLGVEQRLLGDRLRVDVTGYDHEYLDQIAYTVVDPVTFQGSYVNLGKTRARGLEATLEAAPSPLFNLALAYTFLDGVVLASGSTFDPVYAQGQSLLRRPRHQGSVRARMATGRISWGASLILVGTRTDSDFEGLGLQASPGYGRLDSHVGVKVGRDFEAFAVGENLLDRKYMEVLGYPALGRSVRVGLRYRSSGDR
ncbi:MAG TPA: TonB-dependent receptor [Vicinamibacteria bacterium]|nr:TonB-dependent receptor [Vicinamibacteria bacterium]